MIAGDTTEPLFADWEAWLRDPSSEWAGLWSIVAGRAQSLVDDFPTAAAMVKAKLLRIHGPHGLRFRSLFQSDDAPDTTDAEIQTRRKIELAIKRGSSDIDAGGELSRAEFDWCMSYNATVLGDAFAVRVWQPINGVKTSTRWRVIHPARVQPPPDRILDPKYAGGIEIDGNGRPVALWVIESKGADGYADKPTRIPWFAADGTRNVVHKFGLRRPGSRRGLSEFAPIMLPARMLQGVDIAYVTMKRVQASHPMLIKVGDLKAARDQYRGTRIGNLLIGKDHEVTLPPFKFEGSDYRDFVDTTLRGICAAWQIPWELVLGDHSARSGAASRSLWQQHYQMAEREQAQHVEQVQQPIDESIVREAVAVGDLTLTDDWHRNMMGIYQGPPKVMPDPQKEIEWATRAVALGMSKSTVFARMGEDYRDEVMQTRQDKALADAQDVDEPADDAEAEDAADPSEPAEDTPSDTTEDADEGEPADPQQMDAQMTKREFMAAMYELRAMPSMRAAPATAPVTVVNESRVSMDAETARIMGESIAKHMPATVVNVPQAAAPVVNVEAPSVTVAPAHVTVEAAEPAAAPAVTVNVSPTPVTIENTVEVQQRKIIAKPGRDGEVILTPVEG